MILPSKVYDALKWIVMVMIPACTTAYVGLDSVFGWGYGDTVAKVSAIVCTLLGALLGISSAQYYKQEPPDNL
jgi:hypothetical protein